MGAVDARMWVEANAVVQCQKEKLLGAGVRCDMAGRDHHWDMSGDDLWGFNVGWMRGAIGRSLA